MPNNLFQLKNMIIGIHVNFPLLISIISLCISIVSTFYYTRLSNKLSFQTRIANLVDKVYDLSAERNILKKEPKSTLRMSDIQLQMKHLLFEIDKLSERHPLSQSQKRLLADSFGDLLYFDYAEKYWEEIFKESFVTPEIEAEYYRRYAQFLFFKGNYIKGEDVFQRALKLPNDNDSRKYINFQTYMDWASLEYRRDAELFALNRSKEPNTPIPDFVKTRRILNKTVSLLYDFSNYTLYVNALNNYNAIVKLIEDFGNDFNKKEVVSQVN